MRRDTSQNQHESASLQTRRRRRMIAALLGGIVLLSASLLLRPLWQAARTSDSLMEERSRQDDRSEDFDAESRFGAAFAADASVEDLRSEAQRAVQRLVGAFPNAPGTLNVQANLSYEFGNRTEAARLWERCIQLSPDFVEAYAGLARAAFAKGKYETAIEWCRKGLALDYRDVSCQTFLAESLLRLNRLKELTAELEPVLRAGSLAAGTGVPLGQAYLRCGQYENARKAFEAVLAATPGSDRLRKQAHYGLSSLYMMTGQPEKSQEHRDQFRELSDVDLGAIRERIRTTEDLATIRSISVDTHNQCARVYDSQGRGAEAEEMWQKAAVLDPNDLESRTQLALVYERTDRERLSLRICEQLRELEPENPDHWLNVGLLNARLHRFDEALVALEQAVKLEPNNQKYRDVYETIRKNR